jgi:hypothetical protein
VWRWGCGCAGALSEHTRLLLRAALKLLCHMGATPAGRSCIAAAGCLPRWLSQATKLTPSLLQLLLTLAMNCHVDWRGVGYFELLYHGGQWVERALSTEGCASDRLQRSYPPLLKQQVGSLSHAAPSGLSCAGMLWACAWVRLHGACTVNS